MPKFEVLTSKGISQRQFRLKIKAEFTEKQNSITTLDSGDFTDQQKELQRAKRNYTTQCAFTSGGHYVTRLGENRQNLH